MKKLITIVLVTLLISTILVGCGSSEKKDTVQDTNDTGGDVVDTDNSGGDLEDVTLEDVTLEVVWFSDGDEGVSFRRLADEWEAKNPHVKIEMIEVPFNDLEARVRNMISGGQPPAMARLTNLGPFQNFLLDLGAYVSDRDAFANSFTEGLRFDFDGKILGAPNDVTANGLIYNRTLFEQANVAVPQSSDDIWTWDEFEVAIQTVVDNSDAQYGMVFDRSPHRFSTMLYQNGGGLLNEDLSASDFNTPENRETIQRMYDLHESGLIPASVWLGGENPNSLFRTGQIATHFAGSWMIGNYRDEITEFQWGVTYMPIDAQRSSVPGGKYLSAFQDTGVEQETARFIEWLSSAEINARYCEENNYLSQVVGNESLNYDFGSEFFAVFSDELAATSGRPGREWGFQEFTGLVQGEVREQLAEVLAGILTIDEYMANIEAVFNEALADINN